MLSTAKIIQYSVINGVMNKYEDWWSDDEGKPRQHWGGEMKKEPVPLLLCQLQSPHGLASMVTGLWPPEGQSPTMFSPDKKDLPQLNK